MRTYLTIDYNDHRIQLLAPAAEATASAAELRIIPLTHQVYRSTFPVLSVHELRWMMIPGGHHPHPLRLSPSSPQFTATSTRPLGAAAVRARVDMTGTALRHLHRPPPVYGFDAVMPMLRRTRQF